MVHAVFENVVQHLLLLEAKHPRDQIGPIYPFGPGAVDGVDATPPPNPDCCLGDEEMWPPKVAGDRHGILIGAMHKAPCRYAKTAGQCGVQFVENRDLSDLRS
jgi:hypothetical protein